jgi:hypothetical protein
MMKNIVPHFYNKKSAKFTRLGRDENVDLLIDLRTKHMTVEIVDFNEDTQDWEGQEATVSEVREILEDYTYILPPCATLSFRELETLFSHKMLA